MLISWSWMALILSAVMEALYGVVAAWSAVMVVDAATRLQVPPLNWKEAPVTGVIVVPLASPPTPSI